MRSCVPEFACSADGVTELRRPLQLLRHLPLPQCPLPMIFSRIVQMGASPRLEERPLLAYRSGVRAGAAGRCSWRGRPRGWAGGGVMCGSPF
jgi:hypothetical protein